MNPKSLLLKIVLSLLNPSCHNKFPLQGYNVSGSSTPFSEISQSLGYLWMPTYSLELEEKNTFFTYVLFLQFWRDWIFVRFWELILAVCILLWLFLIPFLEKTIVEQGKLVYKGDNIMLVDGENSGEVFIVPQDGYMGSTFKQLWISSSMYKPYVLAFIQFYKETLRNSKKGAAIPHLNKELFYGLIIGIPPLQEQRRMVQKTEQSSQLLK